MFEENTLTGYIKMPPPFHRKGTFEERTQENQSLLRELYMKASSYRALNINVLE